MSDWIGRLESLPGSARLALAWLVCLVPRMLAVALMDLVGDYYVFADAAAQRQSYLYPAYMAMGRVLWTLSAGLVPVFVAWQLALHAALGPLVYAICIRMRLSARSAWLAVCGVAVLPYYVSVAARQPQVGVVISYVAAVLLIFLRWENGGFRLRPGLAFALLASVSPLLRPNLLFSVGVLYAVALGLALVGRRTRPEARAEAGRIVVSGALLTALLAGLAGVTWLRTGHWNPLLPQGGYNLYLGHNPRVGEYLLRYDILSVEDVVNDHGVPPEVVGIDDPYETDRVLGRLAFDFARSHPRETLRNAGLKVVRYWDVRLEDAEKNPLLWNLVFTGPYLVYGGLALLGVLRMARSRDRFALLVLSALLLSYCLPHIVLFPTIRMRMTTEFALVILAADALDGLLVRLAKG